MAKWPGGKAANSIPTIAPRLAATGVTSVDRVFAPATSLSQMPWCWIDVVQHPWLAMLLFV